MIPFIGPGTKGTIRVCVGGGEEVAQVLSHERMKRISSIRAPLHRITEALIDDRIPQAGTTHAHTLRLVIL